MDPVTNPFSPGAGAPPPELVGRQEILERAVSWLDRLKQGRPAESIVLSGIGALSQEPVR